MRNWAILRHHVLGIFRKGHRPWGLPTKLFMVLVFIASLGDVGLTLLSALIGSPELHSMWGVNRDNLYGHVFGFSLGICCITQYWLLYLLEVLFQRIDITAPLQCISLGQ